jgi:hypothetical protein
MKENKIEDNLDKDNLKEASLLKEQNKDKEVQVLLLKQNEQSKVNLLMGLLMDLLMMEEEVNFFSNLESPEMGILF